MRFKRLIVARDIYGCHLDELSPEQSKYLREMIALRELENELIEMAAQQQ